MISSSPPALDVTQTWESKSLDHDRPLTICRCSPCGRFVVAGAQHEDVQRWDLESDERTPLVAHRSWVMALDFHPDQKRLFTGDLHGTVHCWPYADATPQPQWTIADTRHGWVRALQVTADGRSLLTSGNDHVVRQWSSQDGELIREFNGHPNAVFSLAIAADSQTFYSGDLLGNVHHWDLASGKQLRSLDASVLHSRKENFLADVGGVRRMALSDDGTLLACSGMTEVNGNTFVVGKAAVLVFDTGTGQLTQTLRPTTKMDGPLEGLCFLPDNTIVAQGQLLHSSTSLEFWKPDQPEPYHVLKAPTGYSLHRHPDNRRLAAACYQAHGRTGNGRHAEREEYASNNGAVKIYSLFEPPQKPKS